MLMFFCMLLLSGALALSSTAHAYTFEEVPPPFPTTTHPVVVGLTDTDELAGGYVDSEGTAHGFVRNAAGEVTPLLNTTPQSVCIVEGVLHVVGFWEAPGQGGGIRGFLATPATGAFRSLQMPRAIITAPWPTRTEATACGNGKVYGHYVLAGVEHGFIYDIVTRQFVTLDFPDTTRTTLRAVDADGRLLAKVVGVDAVTRLARRAVDGTVTYLTIPGFLETDVNLAGVTTADLLAFTVGSTAFVFDGTAVQAILADSTDLVTQLKGIREDGTVYGRRIDAGGVGRAFLATPTPLSPEPRPRKGMQGPPRRR